MRTQLTAVALTLFVAACGGGSEPPAGTAGPAGSPPEAAAPAAGAAPGAPSAGGVAAPGAGSTPTPGMAGRTTAELLNPDNETMVFLYYDLTGNAPPVDSWVEKDNRVNFAPAIEKAALRQQVRAEIEAGLAAVRGAGLIRLSVQNANLSDYDPTYGEFTVRAIAPSSEITFSAFGQQVAIRFANGRTAQIWKVPAAEAQAIRDKITGGTGYFGNVEIELLLGIRSVQPGPGGGTIITDVLEYELRESRTGTTITRMKLAGA